ncbi:hypothetical protein [Nonomuraea sp. NPDC049607]|uniref:hypothetical protein n=1 Tax=unclassified Nonomuraea TaxID=2593643 RepID=UPI0034256988
MFPRNGRAEVPRPEHGPAGSFPRGGSHGDVPEAGVTAALGEQFVVAAFLHDPAAVEEDDAVGAPDGADAGRG